MPTSKEKAARYANTGTAHINQSKPKFIAKTAGRKAQQERILEALRSGPRTSYELRRDPVGSYQNPTRIFELRQQGYEIETSRVVVVDQDGYVHPGVALYALVAEPTPEEREQKCASNVPAQGVLL
jgi:hypothetical protein